MCPLADAVEARSFDAVLDHLDAGDRRLAPFVAYFERLAHYCYKVLPAWRDA